MSTPPTVVWRALGHSERGANHLKSGAPNQDALRLDDLAPGRTIAALADGHGSAKYCRSDLGARYAVDVAAEQLASLATLLTELPSPARGGELEQESVRIRGRILKEWRTRVEQHLAAEPLSADEHAALNGDNPIAAYGTTLLAAMVVPRFVVYLQIGDGDIVVLQEDAGLQRPFSRDPSLVANETTSLATCAVSGASDGHAQPAVRALKDFNLRVERSERSAPQLILLATDGYANSFKDPAGFERAAPDFLKVLQDNGAAHLRSELPGWLRETSEQGSGDDITVAILYRAVPVAPTWPPAAEEEQP